MLRLLRSVSARVVLVSPEQNLIRMRVQFEVVGQTVLAAANVGGSVGWQEVPFVAERLRVDWLLRD